jgi:hypothetical protein
MYFPNEKQNATDSIFDSSLVMEVEEGKSGKVGKFNFLLPPD